MTITSFCLAIWHDRQMGFDCLFKPACDANRKLMIQPITQFVCSHLVWGDISHQGAQTKELRLMKGRATEEGKTRREGIWGYTVGGVEAKAEWWKIKKKRRRRELDGKNHPKGVSSSNMADPLNRDKPQKPTFTLPLHLLLLHLLSVKNYYHPLFSYKVMGFKL